MLTFHGDEFRIYFAVSHILGKVLGDLRRRGDREHGKYVRIDLAHGGSDGFVAAESVSDTHNYCTSFHSIALKGHTV